MKRKALLLALSSLFVLPMAAPQTATSALTAPTAVAATAATPVPPLVPYAGVALNAQGKPLAEAASATFMIFKDEAGGEPLFTETQSIAFDPAGHYKVLLGATSPKGLAPDIFSTGEARWLEVQIAGQAPQPRVLLASVPYALRAADAATLGGLPASAFALAGAKAPVAAAVGSANVSPDVTSNVTTTGGTSGYLPVFTGSTNVADSIVFQNALGIGIADVPNAALDVNGKVIVRGPFQMARIGNASPSSGVISNQFAFFAQTYDSATKTNIGPSFALQAEPTGNNTGAPGATLNLLYDNGFATDGSETGLYINNNGTLHFAPDQTFPASSATGIAVDGTSTSGIGVEGSSGSGPGVEGTSSSNNGVEGVSPGTTDHTAGIYGVVGTGSGYSNGLISGVWGDATNHTGVSGTSVNFPGIEGISTNSYGLKGLSTNSNGVYGSTTSTASGSAGIYGVYSAPSKEVMNFGINSAIGADTGSTDATALIATADAGLAGIFANNSVTDTTLTATNDTQTSGALVFEADGINGYCGIDNGGDLSCSGTVGGAVKVDNGARQVETYSMQSGENWLEDFGSGQLSSGVTRVELDPTFAQSISAEVQYHVFLTPNGDSRGLYVTAKTATSFEVRESSGGASSVAFDYRIVAKRAGYEHIRFTDVTDRLRRQVEQREEMRHRANLSPHARTAKVPGLTAALAAKPSYTQ